MNLEIFMIKKILKVDSINLLSGNQLRFCFQERWQLEECKYIEKNVIRHIIDNLSNICSDDDNDDDDEIFFYKYLSWLLFSILTSNVLLKFKMWRATF